MGESEMKMDEHAAGSPTPVARMDAKKTSEIVEAPTNAVVDGAADVAAAATNSNHSEEDEAETTTTTTTSVAADNAEVAREIETEMVNENDGEVDDDDDGVDRSDMQVGDGDNDAVESKEDDDVLLADGGDAQEDASGDELQLAGDLDAIENDASSRENHGEDGAKEEEDHNDDVELLDEAEEEEEQDVEIQEVESLQNAQEDNKDEDEEEEDDNDEEEEAADVEGETEVQVQEGDPATSSILKDALKNGNADNSSILNKMKIEDAREGCHVQPSSPGHAELRDEIEHAATPEDGGQITSESFSNEDAIKIEGDSDEDPSMKRKSVDDDDEVDEPAKRLKKEIQQESYLRNKILSEYTEAMDMTNFDQIQGEEDKLIVEIDNLNVIAREKERQWNNIIHMKKMKEELLLRIQRQKHVCMINNGLEIGDGEGLANGNNLQEQNKHQRANSQHLGGKGGALQQNALDMNGHDANKGRNKGSVRNVQSIIADYRQRHPESVPRRGRRIRNVNGNSSETGGGGRTTFTSGNGNGGGGNTLTFANMALGSGAQVRPVDPNSEIALLLNTMENANPESVQNDFPDSAAYKDFLDQIVRSERKQSPFGGKQHQSAAPMSNQYPEVTVHAVTSSSTTSQTPTNSLLHGILTKTQVKNENRTTFSPTLARLLTAPDKTHGAQPNKSSNVSISDILSTNKARSEITITPVTNDFDDAHSKKKHQVDEETEDSVDRLVIDETTDLTDSRTDNNSDGGDDVPQCQGCNQKAAQFVCAGCGNQWYCSRECQVTAWDEHSDVCSG